MPQTMLEVKGQKRLYIDEAETVYSPLDMRKAILQDGITEFATKDEEYPNSIEYLVIRITTNEENQKIVKIAWYDSTNLWWKTTLSYQDFLQKLRTADTVCAMYALTPDDNQEAIEGDFRDWLGWVDPESGPPWAFLM